MTTGTAAESGACVCPFLPTPYLMFALFYVSHLSLISLKGLKLAFF